jgi:hypothetical protein
LHKIKLFYALLILSRRKTTARILPRIRAVAVPGMGRYPSPISSAPELVQTAQN